MTLMTPSVCVFDVQHGFSTLNANFGAIFTAKKLGVLKEKAYPL